jgi:hypothetical protein
MSVVVSAREVSCFLLSQVFQVLAKIILGLDRLQGPLQMQEQRHQYVRLLNPAIPWQRLQFQLLALYC